ncbi:glutaredoxin domain-containing protein [Paradevosia shaoguanensis]|uniref:Glutaredoxin n=1 Tax=Paradevosia shaoguanensis TaxID=1335043 RepID=A0AA41QMC9_9HYPH|nr:glutaredoxin domain-containing protein [Paradevosia shaoguanensis]MCF1742766.1 glutaredoxin [Paradevosia shaoguanensis]MCI0127249.1 glutaredoxin [Paradevosia shaoguanensis]
MPAKLRAVLYRMATPELTCSFGLRAKELLVSKGFLIEEHVLVTRAEVDAFKQAHAVETTPQTFIDGRRIGGYDDLVAYFRSER